MDVAVVAAVPPIRGAAAGPIKILSALTGWTVRAALCPRLDQPGTNNLSTRLYLVDRAERRPQERGRIRSSRMDDQPQLPLIVGAGPTGLAAALFLADGGVRSRIIDRALLPSSTSRAQVVNPRTLELLETTGVSAAILAEARPIHRVLFYEGWEPLAKLEFRDAHPRFPMSVIPQVRTEALLCSALAERQIVPERGVELVTFSQDADGVEAQLTHAGQKEVVRAPLMFCADGAHSNVRAALGIELEGSGFPEAWPLYDLELDDPLDLDSAHVSFVPGGMVFLLCLHPGQWRVFGNVPDLLARLPSRSNPGKIAWESSFHIDDRVASHEVVGRVALAGDAAHIHAPVAARGMNLGIEDAFVFANCAVDVLDGDVNRMADYGTLRHEVHAQVVGRIDRLTRLARGQPAIVGMLRRFVMPAIVAFGPTRRAMTELVTGLDHPVRIAL